MRGFPLLRSLLVLLWLVVSAIGLAKLTSPSALPPHPAHLDVKSVMPDGKKVPVTAFALDVSAEMSELLINGVPHPVHVTRMKGALSEDLKSDIISLVIRWKKPPAAGETRFAKLTIYPPGKPTLTHVFDAPGDIDDILELP